MITTILCRLDNYPGFLGSFDQGATWWKSEPIPGVDEIVGYAWIYGEYHVCAAKMVDGTYSIWQTYNHGYSWREQLNTAERIYCVIRPDYGAGLAATSGGWWRSANSGTDWSKVSTQAPGCHTAKELTRDRLVAVDGTYVWYSDDSGVTWSKSKKHGTSTDATAITLYPSVAGTYNDVFVGCTSTNIGGTGTDRLIYSENGGATFREWVAYWGGNNGWSTRESGRNLRADVVTDIELVATSSGLPTFVIQVLMPSGIFRHYRSVRTIGAYNKLDTSPKFDARATPGRSLDAAETNTPGTDQISRLAMFSGSDGSEPLIKMSVDGGATWSDVKPADATVYLLPDGSGTTDNPFTDDYYVTYSWQHGICHNGWKIVSDHYEKYQSYDMDFQVSPWLVQTATYEAGAYAEGTDTATYKAAPHRIEATGTEDYDADSIIAADHTSTYGADAIAEARRIAVYRMNRHLSGGSAATYQMGALVYSTDFPQINMPQAYRLHFPWIAESGYPYDSREA